MVIVLVVVAFVIAYQLFMRLAPQIGAPPSGSHLERISKSDHYRDGIFVNDTPTQMDFSIVEGLKITWDIITAEGTTPEQPIPTRFGETLLPDDSLPRLTWYGHSAFLLEIEGKRILLDPMLGPASSPLPIFGKRFPYEQPIDLSTIKGIDAVIFSHDHYDHLDYFTIQEIKEEVGHFYVPLGVGSHLRRWGIDEEDITELDWWQESNFEGVTFAATPARHFSGRGTDDRAKTLWASWVIKGQNSTIYFSGDGGYGSHFKTIGDMYGPFDFAMIECGQYNEKWAAIHMMPEESAQAGVDLQAKIIMPIHWGAFSLSLHPWREPANRIDDAAKKLGIQTVYPYIGDPMVIGRDLPTYNWWKDLE